MDLSRPLVAPPGQREKLAPPRVKLPSHWMRGAVIRVEFSGDGGWRGHLPLERLPSREARPSCCLKRPLRAIADPTDRRRRQPRTTHSALPDREFFTRRSVPRPGGPEDFSPWRMWESMDAQFVSALEGRKNVGIVEILSPPPGAREDRIANSVPTAHAVG